MRLAKLTAYTLSQMVIGLCLLSALSRAWGAEPIKFAMTPDHWATTGAVEFVQHKGQDSIELKPGNREQHIMTGEAILNDLIFRSGTIEYDVDATSGMGAGFAFRRRDKDTYELFYLRPRRSAPRPWTVHNTRRKPTECCCGISSRNFRRLHPCGKANGTT